MSTKHNTAVNEEPLKKEYFDDVLDMFYDGIEKNDQLYEELHETYKNNQPVGFSLGASKTTVDLTRTLSELRSNSVQAASALLNAKKTIAELELKKKAQIVEEDKVNNDKEYIRSVLSEIHSESREIPATIKRKNTKIKGRNLVDNIEDIAKEIDRKKLDEVIDSKIESGDLQFTVNENAMKYDFNDEAEVVYDANTESLKAVKKGTNIELKDYPVERGQIGEITRLDEAEGFAHSDNNKKVRITNVKEN